MKSVLTAGGNTYGNQGAGTDCDADGDTSSGYADQCGDGVSGTCGNTNAVYQIASLGAAACHTTDAGAGFAAADEICRNAGARLCTIEELVAGETRGSGCGYDAQQVYSSSSCGTGALAVIGTGQGDTTCHVTGPANPLRCMKIISSENNLLFERSY